MIKENKTQKEKTRHNEQETAQFTESTNYQTHTRLHQILGLCNIDDKQNKWLLHIKLEYTFGAKYKKCIALKETKFLNTDRNHNTNKNVIGFQAD